MSHPAIAENRTAVITGGANGIGFAVAERLVGAGLNVCIADLDADLLAEARQQLEAKAKGGADRVLAVETDVSRLESVEALRDAALDRFGEVALLVNNAGVGGGGAPGQNIEGWRRVFDVNLWGVVNGLEAFSQLMIDQGTDCAIVNTGSKQGITNPPGDGAYNATKAAIKSITESLAHHLRGLEGCRVTAHLLVPGFTYSGMIKRFLKEKPAGAWVPDQVAEYLIDALGRGDFYVICPDNDVTSEMDHLRIQWGAGDMVENRPALSRWHPDHADEFEAFMSKGEG